MRDFFKGWRRKAGCVTLVMAWGLTGMWMRSFVVEDYLLIGRSRRWEYFLISSNSALCWNAHHGWDPDPGSEMWQTFNAKWSSYPLKGYKPLLFKWQGIEVASHYGTVPYSYAVLSLTLLSAYLILWKPRKLTEQGHA